MKQERFRLAFLGGAHDSAVGRVHRIAVEMDQRFELVAGCFSREADANVETGRQYRVASGRVYPSLESLLDHEAGALDAIVILTPTSVHKDQVLETLGRGIPTISEKALVASSHETLAIKEMLEQKAGFLAVTYNYTGYPMLRELRHMAAQGRFGRITQLLLEMPQEGFAKATAEGEPVVPQEWRLHDDDVPMVSLDLGIHLHMMARFLTNERPIELVAMSRSYGNFSQIMDSVSCMASFSNDMTCDMWFCKTALGYRNGLKVRLFGEEGSAEWVQERPEVLHLADRQGHKSIVDRGSPGLEVASLPRYTRFKAGHPSGFIEAFANYYCDTADTLQGYIEGGQAGGNEFVFGVEEALEGIRMFEAIAESSRTKRWVDV